MAPSTAAGASVASGYRLKITRAANPRTDGVSLPMYRRILSQRTWQTRRLAPPCYTWHAEVRARNSTVVEQSRIRDRGRCGGRPTGGVIRGRDFLERPVQVRYTERHRAGYGQQLVVVDEDIPPARTSRARKTRSRKTPSKRWLPSTNAR